MSKCAIVYSWIKSNFAPRAENKNNSSVILNFSTLNASTASYQQICVAVCFSAMKIHVHVPEFVYIFTDLRTHLPIFVHIPLQI